MATCCERRTNDAEMALPPLQRRRRCKRKLIETHCEAEKEGAARYIGGTWNEYERRETCEGKYRAVTTNMHVGSSSKDRETEWVS